MAATVPDRSERGNIGQMGLAGGVVVKDKGPGRIGKIAEGWIKGVEVHWEGIRDLRKARE